MILWYIRLRILFSGQTVIRRPTSKMKFFAAFVLVVACAHADVSHVVRNSAGDADATIVKSEVDTRPDGFTYAWETTNGIRSVANGIIKNVNAENPAQEVTGEFSHVGPDGINYLVTFIANENGYQPQGAHLPTPPPVPEAILRALAYNEAHPQADAKYTAPVAQAYKAASVAVARPVAQAYNTASAFASKTSKFPGRF